MTRVLFLCTGNSCRSQMAEGWARLLGEGQVDAFSAGTQPKGIHPLTMKVMAEVGINLAGRTSKHVDVFAGQSFDSVITVCDSAKEQCPVWPGAPEHIHWSLDDPAEVIDTQEEQLTAFRRVRDEVRELVRSFLLRGRLVPRGHT